MPHTNYKIVNKHFRILGIEVDALTIEQAIKQITAKALDRANGPSYVVKPYVEFLERCIREPELIALLNNAEWCLPDGIALNWAAHYLYGGQPSGRRLFATLAQIVFTPRRIRSELPDRFGGTNFTWPLLEAAAKQNLGVYLIGSPKDQSIQDTTKWLTEKLPGLKIVGSCSGHLTPRLEEKLASELARLQPDLILAGLGFPLQEQLIVRLMPAVKHGVFVGEGGTFDYAQFGGRHAKAPEFVQTIGLEWLWRLILEPQRLMRQLAIPRFIAHVYAEGQELSRQAR